MDNSEKLATQDTHYLEKPNSICDIHHYAQTNTNNPNKTWTLPTGGKDEPNIVVMWKW